MLTNALRHWHLCELMSWMKSSYKTYVRSHSRRWKRKMARSLLKILLGWHRLSSVSPFSGRCEAYWIRRSLKIGMIFPKVKFFATAFGTNFPGRAFSLGPWCLIFDSFSVYYSTIPLWHRRTDCITLNLQESNIYDLEEIYVPQQGR